MMTARSIPQHGETNLLGDALEESRLQFRQIVATIDRLVEQNRKDDARNQLTRLETLGKELHRLLNPRDKADQKNREQIDRELQRLQRTLRPGLSGMVGTSLIALVLGVGIGIAALTAILWMWFN